MSKTTKLPADREERLEHIKVAALLLGGTHSAAALARSRKISVAEVYRWRDLALGYDDPEASALRETFGRAEHVDAAPPPAPHVACLRLGDDWFRVERVTGDRVSNATQEAQGLTIGFPDLEELVYLSGRYGHGKMLRLARLAVSLGLDRAAELLKRAVAGDDENALYQRAIGSPGEIGGAS